MPASEEVEFYREQVLEATRSVQGELKAFQKDTVAHIDKLFRAGKNRVLVSDEVGLGKTLVAKGVIASTAILHLEEADDPFFKVIYVCSNAAIVNQNLSKLSIDEDIVSRVDASQARLSMQHYFSYINEIEAKQEGRYIQLVPMTPGTSFDITKGAGIVQERALIFAVLRHQRLFRDIVDRLESMLDYQAPSSWGRWRGEYVSIIDSSANEEYRKQVCEELEQYADELVEIRNYALSRTDRRFDSLYIGKLRSVFARLSIDRLDPDLVIMDEFQRFRHLLNRDGSDELSLVSNKFLFSSNREKRHLRALLLSATPFRAFTTMAEDEETFFGESSSHDFMNVVSFLDEEDGEEAFKRVWDAYGSSLNAFVKSETDISQIVSEKQEAERYLRHLIARTERIGLSEYKDIVCDKTKKVDVDKLDITSQLAAVRLFGKLDVEGRLPLDYLESCPYVLSYLKGYKSGDSLLKAVERNVDSIPFKREDASLATRLWVPRYQVRGFKKLDIPSSRMRELMEDVFYTGADGRDASSLLWVPASRPYYRVDDGPYARVKAFSKTLVFSAWTMVPRMMSTLISYEDERRSVIEVYGQEHNIAYFDPKADDPETFDDVEDVVQQPYARHVSRRLPSKRLRVRIAGHTGAVFLMYPSLVLKEMVDWPEFASDAELSELINLTAGKIESLLGEMGIASKSEGRDDYSWYLKAVLMLEHAFGADVGSFLNSIIREDGFSSDDKELARIWKRIDEMPVEEFGDMPENICEVLAQIAIASPAVCAMRTYQKCRKTDGLQLLGFRFASALLRRLNTPSATLAVEAGDLTQRYRSHWSRTLAYCAMGNFQAVLDEWGHQIGYRHSAAFMCNEMIGPKVGRFGGPSTYTMHSQYDVDYLHNLRNRASNRANDVPMKMRTAYAAAFIDDESGGSNDNRRENLRKAFNSPFRPFVLCSTSIGQEGLDFHAYCRKVVHWNLPSNPVDLEQREGRINRYESMAVRQNVARRDDVALKIKEDIWEAIFEKAEKAARDSHEGDFAELAPHWGLEEYDPDLMIERQAYLRSLGVSSQRYEKLKDVLVRYRAVLGQPRQEELLERLGEVLEDECGAGLKELFMDLSPFNYEHK